MKTRTIEISVTTHEDTLHYNVRINFHTPALFSRRGAWRKYENVSPASVSRLQDLTHNWRMFSTPDQVYMTTNT